MAHSQRVKSAVVKRQHNEQYACVASPTQQLSKDEGDHMRLMSSYTRSDLKQLAQRVVPHHLQTLARRALRKESDLDPYRFPRMGTEQIIEDIRAKYGFDGDLLRIFANNKSGIVHKWHHYIPIYDHYLSPYRGQKLRFLEIGVSKGGSLQMWREYFGPQATIYGIDIDQACRSYDGIAAQVRIGSQVDGDFLRSVIDEMGGIDVVLDDGSHHMEHVRKTLRQLFPKLSDGGLYMIEDLHTAYWRDFGGGYRSRKNFFQLVLDLSHDIHRWYHRQHPLVPGIGDHCRAVHVHDSIVVLEKGKVFAPVHSRVGSA